MKPIYVQIAEWLENEILNHRIQAHDKMYSQYQLAELFNINPATAGKGITKLLDDDLIYKKRGLGTFVSDEARLRIIQKRKEETLQTLIDELVLEADYLNVSDDELIERINQARKGGSYDG
ncbi:DNA-binding transcriptional regulator YhcF (GntR family) [Alkalibacillus salilacus]|uniref:DNA-binding transcriptional regulator YhcF (GntR family) n=2 Tax=Alkalibacillus salilacus TaxID=284582 RepID=A0ABT9VEL3_9BACI|nr:DNA-binding transcriptional regulator YhcF (GntR family) [Alkalibacillus salilacus]